MLCPEWFDKNKLPAISDKCHEHDKASILIGEFTRLDAFGSTSDRTVPGYDALRQLQGKDNLRHTETYALFAQGKS